MATAEIGKRYRHYKGKEYIVLFLAYREDTLESVVVYQAEYNTEDFGDRPVWVRSKDDFESTVIVDGVAIDRFMML